MLFRDRFPHGIRHMASGTGAKRDEFKLEQHHLISSADDPVHDRMISVGEQFAITQSMYSEKNGGAIKKFIACFGHVQPTNCEDVRRVSVNILDGVGDASRETVGVQNGKTDDQWVTMDVVGKDHGSTTTGFTLCRDGKDGAMEGNEVDDGEEYASSAGEEDVSLYGDGCSSNLYFLWMHLIAAATVMVRYTGARRNGKHTIVLLTSTRVSDPCLFSCFLLSILFL